MHQMTRGIWSGPDLFGDRLAPRRKSATRVGLGDLTFEFLELCHCDRCGFSGSVGVHPPNTVEKTNALRPATSADDTFVPAVTIWSDTACQMYP
jgi:hypothetical protein